MMRRSWLITVLEGALLGTLLALSACGPDSGGGTLIGPPASKTSPGSGVFAVDCSRQRAYVPLDTFDLAGNGRVSVIDLGANPDLTDPRIVTVSLTHPDIPTGTALDNDHSLIIVVSGRTLGQDGKLDLINEATNTLVAGSPFPFPAGSQAGRFGQVLYDATAHRAIVATCDTAFCFSTGSPLTGFVTFNTISHAFGTIVPANYAESFAFNDKSGVLIDASDSDNNGEIGGVELTKARACTLSDSNIGGDNDGTSFDSSTNIAVISNEATNATVINLNGSSFAPSTGTPCTLNEGGTPPNSVLVTGLPSATAGSAVDAVNHWDFVISDGGPGMALLTLPTRPVANLVPGDITATSSNFPDDPLGALWRTAGDPYAVAVASCTALPHTGFAVNRTFTFLAEVDLQTLLSTPLVIPTAPPAGQCAGTASTVTKCNNLNGVVFFPLPGVL